jgi:hypothetical protein
MEMKVGNKYLSKTVVFQLSIRGFPRLFNRQSPRNPTGVIFGSRAVVGFDAAKKIIKGVGGLRFQHPFAIRGSDFRFEEPAKFVVLVIR